MDTTQDGVTVGEHRLRNKVFAAVATLDKWANDESEHAERTGSAVSKGCCYAYVNAMHLVKAILES